MKQGKKAVYKPMRSNSPKPVKNVKNLAKRKTNKV